MIHTRCRNAEYADFAKRIQRAAVPDELTSWTVNWPEYSPPDYTSPFILGKPWADPDIGSFEPCWNTVDGPVNRVSYTGIYEIVDGRPRNPIGRTGLKGRGILGKWGPNHAADPIVTRWKRNKDNVCELDKETSKPILQFVAIKRRDTGEWAIPGGMVDAGEQINDTLKREFMEEVLAYDEKDESERRELTSRMEELFRNGMPVYKGYVDDPRNTDNSWMETVATHFHDDTGSSVGAVQFQAGDDAVGVRWVDVERRLRLYASHASFFEAVTRNVGASW